MRVVTAAVVAIAILASGCERDGGPGASRRGRRCSESKTSSAGRFQASGSRP